MRLAELRADEVRVIRHPAQDRVHDGFGRIAAAIVVAMNLLDPLEIHDRHDAEPDVAMLRDVHLVGDRAAVQAFVEQQLRL